MILNFIILLIVVLLTFHQLEMIQILNGYLATKMRTHIIKLYYIENFKYTLDVSQYTIENGENIDTSKRGNTYMFTITPKLEDDYIENITVDSSQIHT